MLQLLGRGKGLGEIADALQISSRTVSIMKRKLNVSTQGKLLQIAIEHAKPKS